MWRVVKGLVVLAATAAAMLLAVSASGLLPFGAADGGWSAGEWLRTLSTRQSVALRAIGTSPPALDEPSLVMRGAGHFETACRRCHGTPGGDRPLALRHMVPAPPDLQSAADKYSDAELFQIIMHGIRWSGMPGWPSQQRDDEVWAMVAFVRHLPQISGAEYRRLSGAAFAPAAAQAPEPVRTTCVRCHGVDGLGRDAGAFPILAGQRAEYLHRSLRAYAFGGRHSGLMTPIAAELTDAEMMAIASYYSQMPGLSADVPPAEDRGGDNIIESGVPTKRVPPCASCHAGVEPFNTAYPVLAGQYPEYLALQLRLFAERKRGGTAYAHVMHPAADGLDETGRQIVARRLGATTPRPLEASAQPVPEALR